MEEQGGGREGADLKSRAQSSEQGGSPLTPPCPQASRQTPCKATGTGSMSSFTGTSPGRGGGWRRVLGLPGWGLAPLTSCLRPRPRSLRNFFRRASDMLYFKRLIQIPRLPEVPAPSRGRRQPGHHVGPRVGCGNGRGRAFCWGERWVAFTRCPLRDPPTSCGPRRWPSTSSRWW